MIFESWFGTVRVLIVGPLAYVSLILLLRVSGKRTLATLNTFDLVATVALGSTLASVLLSKLVALVEGTTGTMVLVGMQYAVASLCVRSRTVSDLTKSEPSLLLRDGLFLDRALCQRRIAEAEVLAASRSVGAAGRSGAAAVILGTDSSLSVIGSAAGPSASALVP